MVSRDPAPGADHQTQPGAQVGSLLNDVDNLIGEAGSGNGQLVSPNGIAIDELGDIWVVDTGDDRVQEWCVSRP